MKKLFIVLFSLGLLFMFSCGDEGVITEQKNNLVPAAPDNPTPIPDWTAHNLRIKEWSDGGRNIIVWVSFEKNGTQTVSKRILISKE